MKTTTTALLTLVIVLILTAPASAQDAVPVPFTTVMKGQNGAPATARQAVIQDAAALKAFLGQDPPAGAVDFASEILLAVGMGDQPTGGHAVEITRIVEVRSGPAKGVTAVEFKERRPLPDEVVTKVPTRPFHVVKLKREERRFVFSGKLGPLSKPGRVLAGRTFTLAPRGSFRFVTYENQIWGMTTTLTPEGPVTVRRRILQAPPPEILGSTSTIEYTVRAEANAAPGSLVTVSTKGHHQVKDDPGWTFSFEVRVVAPAVIRQGITGVLGGNGGPTDLDAIHARLDARLSSSLVEDALTHLEGIDSPTYLWAGFDEKSKTLDEVKKRLRREADRPKAFKIRTLARGDKAVRDFAERLDDGALTLTDYGHPEKGKALKGVSDEILKSFTPSAKFKGIVLLEGDESSTGWVTISSFLVAEAHDGKFYEVMLKSGYPDD